MSQRTFSVRGLTVDRQRVDAAGFADFYAPLGEGFFQSHRYSAFNCIVHEVDRKIVVGDRT